MNVHTSLERICGAVQGPAYFQATTTHVSREKVEIASFLSHQHTGLVCQVKTAILVQEPLAAVRSSMLMSLSM